MGVDRIGVALEFAPTITLAAGVYDAVTKAFVEEGVHAVDFERPANELIAERAHPDWKWAEPTLRVHLIADLSASEVIANIGGPIALPLASVRRLMPELPIDLRIDQVGRQTGLTFRHDDSPDEIPTALRNLPTDIDTATSVGWNRQQCAWITL